MPNVRDIVWKEPQILSPMELKFRAVDATHSHNWSEEEPDDALDRITTLSQMQQSTADVLDRLFGSGALATANELIRLMPRSKVTIQVPYVQTFDEDVMLVSLILPLGGHHCILSYTNHELTPCHSGR